MFEQLAAPLHIGGCATSPTVDLLGNAAAELEADLAERFPSTPTALRALLGITLLTFVCSRVWATGSAPWLAPAAKILTQRTAANESQISTMTLIADELFARLERNLSRLLDGELSVEELGSALSAQLREDAFADPQSLIGLRAQLASLEGALRSIKHGLSTAG